MIYPVTGDFIPLNGVLLYGFLQWLDDFGLYWLPERGHLSSYWLFFPLEGFLSEMNYPVTGYFSSLRCLLAE